MFSFGRRAFVSSALAFGLFAGASGEASAQPTSFAGQRLGRNHQGEEVKVVREVGSSAGYEDRLQATAVARMSNADPTVVVKGRDNKWHALATTANAYGGLASAADNFEVRELVPLPSNKAISAGKGGMSEKAYFALVLGVTENEIETTYASTNRLAGKINVNGRLVDLGKHGAEKSENEDFKQSVASAIELQRGLFESGDRRSASAVLFHERSHLADFELARHWANIYAPGKKDAFNSAEQQQFMKWLFLPAQRRSLSADDAQTIGDIAANVNGSTEARAYIGTFIAAMHAGAPDLARDQLLTYAKNLGKKIALPTSELVPAALRADLDAAYRSLDANGKKQFLAAFAAAKAAAPNAWISKFEPGSAKRS